MSLTASMSARSGPWPGRTVRWPTPRGRPGGAPAARVDDLTVGQRPAEAPQEAAADGTDHRAGTVDDLVDRAGVVLVLVTDEHQRDLAQADEQLDVLVVLGSGVDDDHLVAARPFQHPRV